MPVRAIYLDSSAAVKLFKDEPESEALSRWLAEHGDASVVTSDLARTEVRRALHSAGATNATAGRCESWLARCAILRLTPSLCDRAGAMMPGTALRSLDAVHVQSALTLGPALTGFVAYDSRLCDTARRAGLTVITPE